MQIPRNKFKSKFPFIRPQYGIWNGLADTMAAEIVAGAGFDWVLIDGEHGPFDLRTIQLQLQVMCQFDIPVLVRAANDEPHTIQQLVDIGVQTLLIPMVETKEQAKRVFQSMHYPPLGTRGVGTALIRSAQWNRVNHYFEDVDQEMCLLVQVETVTGMMNLDDILKTPGVDGVFIGPSDLAASMGHLGKPDHPEVKSSIVSALAKIKTAGKIAGVMALSKPLADQYTDAGATMVAVAIDTVSLAQSTSSIAQSFIGTREESTTRY